MPPHGNVDLREPRIGRKGERGEAIGCGRLQVLGQEELELIQPDVSSTRDRELWVGKRIGEPLVIREVMHDDERLDFEGLSSGLGHQTGSYCVL